MNRCFKPIYLDEQKISNTYCQLPEGHKGECSQGADETKPKRCPSISPNKARCELPERHYGNHWSQRKLASWENKFQR